MNNTLLHEAVRSNPTLTESTKRSYERSVDDFVRYAGADQKRWTPLVAQHYYNGLLKVMKPQSANCKVYALRYASKRLAQLLNDPAADFAHYVQVKRGRRDSKIRALTAEEAGRLIAACHGERPEDLRDYAIAVLGFETGMRRFSICGIRFEDFAHDRRYHTTTVEITVKGQTRFVVPLSPRALAALEPLKQWLRRHGTTSGFIFRNMRPRVDEKSAGRELRPGGLYRAMARRAKAAGVKGFTPHCFRHSLVTWLKAANVSNATISALTGHVLDKANESRMLDSTYLDRAALAGEALAALGRVGPR